MLLENFHLLLVKHVAETNNTPARVKIRSDRFEQSVFIPYSNQPGSITPAKDTAIAYLLGKGFNLVGQAEIKSHYVLITDSRLSDNTFLPLK